MRGLIAARTAVMTAVAAIDADMRRTTRASSACCRLMTIPGVGQLITLAFVAAIDDPSRIHRSRDVGAYLGLVPKRYQSGDDGTDFVACGQPATDCDFNQATLHPAYPIKRRRARTEHRPPTASKPGKSIPP
jgi:hypothetical protein